MFEQEAADLYGQIYRPTTSKYRRVCAKMVNLDTTERQEWRSKARVQDLHDAVTDSMELAALLIVGINPRPLSLKD